MPVLISKMTSPEKEKQIGAEILERKTSDSPHEHQRSTATFQIESSGVIQGTIQQNQDNPGHSEQTGQVNMMKCLLPHELVRAPAIGLPRTDEVSEDITPSAPAQPSRKLHGTSSTSNSMTIDTTSEGRVTRRSARIQSRGVGDSSPLRQSGTRTYYQYGRRPLYLTHKKDEYEWFYPSSDEEL